VNTRTVRLLDRRPGQPADDARTVAGYVIEKGVPLPKARDHTARQKEALLALAVGDSIVFPDQAKDARAALRKSHPEREFTRRRVKGSTGQRIWRIA
jgi:hypothetical protein